MADDTQDDYTQDEKDTIAMAVYGSVGLVSSAAGGLFAKAKEGIAGLRAVSHDADWLMRAIQGADVASEISDDSDVVQPKVLAAIPRALQIIGSKDPRRVEGFKTAVVDAMQAAAEASKGVNDREAAVMSTIRDALGA